MPDNYIYKNMFKGCFFFFFFLEKCICFSVSVSRNIILSWRERLRNVFSVAVVPYLPFCLSVLKRDSGSLDNVIEIVYTYINSVSEKSRFSVTLLWWMATNAVLSFRLSSRSLSSVTWRVRLWTALYMWISVFLFLFYTLYVLLSKMFLLLVR